MQRGSKDGAEKDNPPRIPAQTRVGPVVSSSHLLRSVLFPARCMPSLRGDQSEGETLPKRCQAHSRCSVNTGWMNH